MNLPLRLSWQAASDRWASIITPFINNPSNSSVILQNVSLVVGSNVVNHKLGRKLQGWKTSRIRAAATIYDTQDSNQTPQLTLNLVSDAPTVVDLEVY